MSLPRVLFCIIFPPLAVYDKGCGSLVLVCLLTLVGWVPGCIAALLIVLKSEPGMQLASSSKFSPRRLRSLAAGIPARGPYEESATDAQRDLLWRIGYTDTGMLEAMGKVQAMALIGAATRDARARAGLFGGIGVLLMVFVVIAAVVKIGPRVRDRIPHTWSIPSMPSWPASSSSVSSPVSSSPTPVPASAQSGAAATPVQADAVAPELPPDSSASSSSATPAPSATPADAAQSKPTPLPAPRYMAGMRVILLHEKTFVGAYGSMVMPSGSVQTVIGVQKDGILIGDSNFQSAVHENEISPAPRQ